MQTMAPTAGMMAPGKMYLGVIGANDGSHRGDDGSGEDVSGVVGGNRCATTERSQKSPAAEGLFTQSRG